MNRSANDPREKNNKKYTAVFPGAVYPRLRERRQKSRDDPRTTGERC